MTKDPKKRIYKGVENVWNSKAKKRRAKAVRKQKRPEDEEKKQLINQARKLVPAIDEKAMMKYDIKTLKHRLDMAIMKQSGLFYSTWKGAKKVINTPMK